jgi:hypothetical protein
MDEPQNEQSWSLSPAMTNYSPYNVFFPSGLTFAHLAFAAAASLAFTAGLLRRSFFLAGLGVTFVPFTLVHLARHQPQSSPGRQRTRGGVWP